MRFVKYFFVVAFTLALIFLGGSQFFKKHTHSIFVESVAKAPYDAIIVPGIPHDNIEPNYMFRVRMHWAKYLFDKGIARNIIFSGAAVHTPYVEGICMKAMADSMGIPPHCSFAEISALHGTENISYGLKLAAEKGFSKVAVATDPFQSFFLQAKTAEEHPTLAFLPLSVDSMEAYSRPLPRIDLEHIRVPHFIPLKER